jgi:CTP:molybdopterin cytidylyltransferase MocA
VQPPRVTVVLPVYNGAPFVADAIDSVIGQHDASVELVVVDDGSTDDTPRLLERLADRAIVIRQPNRGLAAARNAGIARARGEYLLFLDADDLHPPGFAARFLAAAAGAPEADVLHCGWRAIDFAGRPLYARELPLALDADPFHELAVLGSPHIGALLLRRSAGARVGPFDTGLDLQEDWDYWLRLAAAGASFRAAPDLHLLVRRHPASMAAVAGGRLARVGLAVLERQLERHGRCPRCARSDLGLAQWRRVAVRSSALDLARRLGLSGGAGRWITTMLVAFRRPRLARAAVVELAAGWRRRRTASH